MKENEKALFSSAAGALITGIIGLVGGTALAGPIAIGGGIGLVIWGIGDLCSQKKEK